MKSEHPGRSELNHKKKGGMKFPRYGENMFGEQKQCGYVFVAVPMTSTVPSLCICGMSQFRQHIIITHRNEKQIDEYRSSARAIFVTLPHCPQLPQALPRGYPSSSGLQRELA